MKGSQLTILLNRGDNVRIENGQLIIDPASGNAEKVPSFIKENGNQIINEALKLVDVRGYRYKMYSTGHYRHIRSTLPGVTLQFIDLLTREYVPACFNAHLDRQRNSAKGKRKTILQKNNFG
jgi:hypothetical protein